MEGTDAAISLATVAQLDEFPDRYELHYGEPAPPAHLNFGHVKIRCELQKLLAAKLAGFGEVTAGFPFRPLAEFEYRRADVAAVSRSRWDATHPDDDFFGAPELVIALKAPSKTTCQLRQLTVLCLANGAVECWIADPAHASVTVTRGDGSSTVYRCGEAIPLDAFGSGKLPVTGIFEDH